MDMNRALQEIEETNRTDNSCVRLTEYCRKIKTWGHFDPE